MKTLQDIDGIFNQELLIVEQSQTIIDSSTDGKVDSEAYCTLLESYKNLLRQSNKLTRVSDNSQRKLIKVQEKLEASSEEIRASNDKLTELNATKDKFFSIISHDMRNPIASVLMMTELLKNHLDKMSREELHKKLEKINKAVDALYNLFENLHRWSLSQSGNINYNPVSTNLLLLAKNIYTQVKVQADNKNIAIDLDVEPEYFVCCDENMVGTVIRNLLSNAIKFTPKGGRITVRAFEKGEMTHFSVTDTGVGIEKDRQDMLFSIGNKVQTKGTEKENGSGLGLVVCKEFVECHGGSIWVESKKGEGSTFMFTIPNSVCS